MKRMMLMVAMLAGCGAQHVKVEPVKIQPIHITVDVNVNDGPTKPSPVGDESPR